MLGAVVFAFAELAESKRLAGELHSRRASVERAIAHRNGIGAAQRIAAWEIQALCPLPLASRPFGLDCHTRMSMWFMAVVDLQPTRRVGRSRAELRSAFGAVCGEVSTLPSHQSLRLVREFAAALAAVEAQLVAAQVAGGVPSRIIDAAVGAGSTRTAGEAARIRRRGAAVASNPDLAGAVSSGSLTLASLDALASVDESADGAAANDARLIDQLAAGGPQQAGRIARDWAHRRETNERLEKRRQKQLRLRTIERFTDHSSGLDVLMAKGDRETIDMMWRRVSRDADRAYRADGGRDVPASKHPRTRHQRMFDSFAAALTGETPVPADDDSGVEGLFDGVGSDRGEPGSGPGEVNGSNGFNNDRGVGRPRGTGRRAGWPDRDRPHATPARRDSSGAGCSGSCSGKPLWIITQTIDTDGTLGLPNLAGTGPLPQTVSDRLGCAADIAGLVFGGKGHPLWISSSERPVSPALRRALVARDGGCVLTGAPPEQCQSHHINPWTSRLGGETHIETLALLSAQTHRWLHDNQLTLVRNPDRTWTTRPATPDELPAPQKANPRRTPKQRK